MNVKLILVEPKYQVNLGYIARTAMNFGVKRLFVVRPRAKLSGENARMYSKHAYALLEHAKVYKNIDDATKNCSLVLGTTGIKEKAKSNFNRICLADEAVEKLGKLKGNGTVALLIGRDDTGLRSDEIEKCDMLAYIPTNPEYPVLNISHSLAIFLYLFNRRKLSSYYGDALRSRSAGSEETRTLLVLFEKMIGNKKMRNRRAVLGAFRRLISNSQPSRLELHALITAFKR